MPLYLRLSGLLARQGANTSAMMMPVTTASPLKSNFGLMAGTTPVFVTCTAGLEVVIALVCLLPALATGLVFAAGRCWGGAGEPGC